MTVGIDREDWQAVVAVMVHEAVEASLAGMNLRYAASPDFSNDNGNWFFAMTHTQLSEACAQAGCFLADCLPDLKKAYNKRGSKK